jgi:hypothetical protein
VFVVSFAALHFLVLTSFESLNLQPSNCLRLQGISTFFPDKA